MAPSARAGDLEDSLGMDAVREAAGSYLEGYLDVDGITGSDFSRGAAAILTAGRGEAVLALHQAGRSGVALLGIALLCGLWEAAEEILPGRELDPVRLAGTAAVTAVALGDVNALMGLGQEALTRLDVLAKALLPAVTAICAASGAPSAAAAGQGAALLFFNLLVSAARGVVLPLTWGYVCASAAHAALGGGGLRRLAALLKWAAAGLLAALMTGFVLFLSVTGVVAGNADALAMKTAKTALSGMVPVVGGILSDAAGAVVAGAGVLKGTAGVMGLLAVLCVCLGPFLRLGCHYLVYKLAAALAATVWSGPVCGLMDDLVGAFALVLGMVGGGGLILYISLITAMKAVTFL